VAHPRTSQRWRYLNLGFLICIFAAANGRAQSSSTAAFSGRAYVVQATVPPLEPITVSDTNELPPTGGAQQAALLEVQPIPLGNVGALNGADVASATAIGQGNASRSAASLADLSLTVAGNTIAAGFLMAEATAQCQGSGASISGNSQLAKLIINDQTITISGATNQTIPLPLDAGYVRINEQSGSANGQSGTLDVNALHVVANNPTMSGGAPLADVVIAHAHADIVCPASPPPPPPCATTTTDFVTGGGWITSPSDPNAKANFAVAGGKDGTWGHLMYIDHVKNLRVKSVVVSGYGLYPPFGPTGRYTGGTADTGGTTSEYEADVADNGEPGSGDEFQLQLNGVIVAHDHLGGGNIQLHRPQCQ
jgi:hypothetical protein